MKVDLICAGSCRDNGKPTQIAGCGVIVELIDDHDRRQIREFGWALGSSTSNLADIQAARLALSSVLPQFRGYYTTLHVCSKYVFNLLSRTDSSKQAPYTITPKKNLHEISELRKWFGYYKSISVIRYDRSGGNVADGPAPTNEIVLRVGNLARNVMESQQHFDSGTIEIED